MSFIVDTSGLLALMDKVANARDAIPMVMEAAMAGIGLDAVTELSIASPYDASANNGVLPGEEGHLNESFSASDVIPTAEGADVEVKTSEPIKFFYVTEGTVDVEPIFPLYKRALWWPDAAHPYAFVHGQQANPFHKQVLQDLESGEPLALARDDIIAILEG